jgi:predicted small metal-binding protein
MSEQDPEPRVNLVVECACGWTTQGEENQVIEAMQVHTRLIHGREITREEVLAQAKQA